MPRTPTIYFNKDEFEKLKKTAEKLGYPSVYAYIKDTLKKNLEIFK